MKCPVCNTKELVGRQKVCSGACRVKLSRMKETPKAEALPEKQVGEVSEDAPVDHPDQPERISGLAYEVPKGTAGAKWRSVTTHPKGGYWVIPGRCKWGECLDPTCRFSIVDK